MIGRFVYNGTTVALCLFLVFCGSKTQKSEAEETPPTTAVQKFIIRPVDDQMLYEQKEITAKTGTKIKIIFENTATNAAMHHNVVILKTSDAIQAVGMAAIQAGEARDYIPEHETIIAHTPMSAPGKTVEVEFTVPPPGDYPYICTFPGHWVTMRGTLHSVN